MRTERSERKISSVQKVIRSQNFSQNSSAYNNERNFCGDEVRYFIGKTIMKGRRIISWQITQKSSTGRLPLSPLLRGVLTAELSHWQLFLPSFSGSDSEQILHEKFLNNFNF